MAQCGVEQRAGRDVDSYLHRDARIEPRTDLCQREIDHLQCERADQTGLLGELDELRRWQQASGRVVPSHERLYPADRLLRERHLRLEVHDQLVSLDRLTQLTEQQELALSQ